MKIILLFSLILFLPKTSQANFCLSNNTNNIFSQPSFPAEISWRSAASHKNNSGAYFPSSVNRESEISRVRQAMENEILGIGMPGDTPPIEFFSQDGTIEKYLSHSNGANHQLTRIEVSKASLNANHEAVLNGTLLVPASGHTGVANAKVYAANDTYTIRYEVSLDAQGTQFASGYGYASAVLIQDAKSLGFVTCNEIGIPLVKDRVTRIFYFRSGSGGPAGYFDGRIIDFVWDGTTI